MIGNGKHATYKNGDWGMVYGIVYPHYPLVNCYITMENHHAINA